MKFGASVVLCGIGICLMSCFLGQQWSLYVDLQDRKLPCEIERLAWDLSSFDENIKENCGPPIEANFLRLNAYPQLYHNKPIRTFGYLLVPRRGQTLLLTSHGKQQNAVSVSISEELTVMNKFAELEGRFTLAGSYPILKLDTVKAVLDKEIPWTAECLCPKCKDRTEFKGNKK